jgi:hypothetical protein
LNQQGGRTDSTDGEKLTANCTEWEKCTQVELELETALNELTLVKFINCILHEEITALKHPTRANSKDAKLYTRANSYNSSFPTENRLPKMLTHLEVTQIPVTILFQSLCKHSESQQPNGTTLSSDFEQLSGFLPRMSINYGNRHHWKKSPSIKHFILPTTHPLDNPTHQQNLYQDYDPY